MKLAASFQVCRELAMVEMLLCYMTEEVDDTEIIENYNQNSKPMMLVRLQPGLAIWGENLLSRASEDLDTVPQFIAVCFLKWTWAFLDYLFTFSFNNM